MSRFGVLGAPSSMGERGWLAILWMVGGCGAEADGDVGDPVDQESVPDGWTELVGADWTLPSGTEEYVCARVTLREDLLVTAVRPLAPQGTHHTATALGPPSGPDGTFGCTAEEAGTDPSVLFAGGVGTDELTFPEGAALPLPAGGQITLNLHLFNVTDAPRSGHSGLLVRIAPAERVTERVAFVTIGDEAPRLEPSSDPVDATVGCTFAERATLLDLWPHMHQVGRHTRVALDDEVLLDRAFSFGEQLNDPIAHPVEPGQTLRHTCTWVNDTDHVVDPGNSSGQEMCVLGVYLTPASAVPDCPGL